MGGLCVLAGQGELGLHHDREHEPCPGAQGGFAAVAGGFEFFQGFVTEAGLAGSEASEGFQSHGTDGDTVFGEASADEGQQAHALGVGHGVHGSGNEDVSAGLPYFHRESGGEFCEEVALFGDVFLYVIAFLVGGF